jgi:hypothetical protein
MIEGLHSVGGDARLLAVVAVFSTYGAGVPTLLQWRQDATQPISAESDVCYSSALWRTDGNPAKSGAWLEVTMDGA